MSGSAPRAAAGLVCMIYINTLMIQKVLSHQRWQDRLTPRDYAALTRLIWEHVNPYGRFDLDMNKRLAGLAVIELAAGVTSVGSALIITPAKTECRAG